MSDYWEIFCISLTSRVIVILIVVATFSFQREYDSSTSIFFSRDDYAWLSWLVDPFVRWDAIHYLSIAKQSYSYEHQLAFQPLLPILIRFFSCGSESLRLMALTGLIISLVSFIGAAMCLYNLSLRIDRKESAYISTIFFCISPASPFLTSIYTESLFAFVTFCGLCLFVRNRILWTTFFWSMASLCRSNGVFLSGYFIYRIYPLRFRKDVLILILLAVLTIMPFLLFQVYARLSFCPGESGICSSLPYSYVQKRYWNVGFLKYFQFKQIPNFLIASPILVFSFFGISTYLKYYFTQRTKCVCGYLSNSYIIFPSVILWFVTSISVLLFMHVQIASRFLSSIPCLYWYATHLSMCGRYSEYYRNRLVLFCIVYATIGTVLFSCFYPPA